MEQKIIEKEKKAELLEAGYSFGQMDAKGYKHWMEVNTPDGWYFDDDISLNTVDKAYAHLQEQRELIRYKTALQQIWDISTQLPTGDILELAYNALHPTEEGDE